MKIYLCSRVAVDAHDLNNFVAEKLRDDGHTVFVPHEQHYNQIIDGTAKNISDKVIYEQDFTAMKNSHACVVVGRIGVDCGYEVGWFRGKGLPVYWYAPTEVDVGRHPMLHSVPRYTVLSPIRKRLRITETLCPPSPVKRRTLAELGREAFQTACAKGFYEVHREPLEFHALIHSEVSEATEAVREGIPLFYKSSGDGKPEGEAVELADAVIRIADYCEHRGIDLDAVIDEKLKYNATRPYRHGGKKK